MVKQQNSWKAKKQGLVRIVLATNQPTSNFSFLPLANISVYSRFLP
ncbi:MAG: hypothetical protein ACI9G1_004396, partial [Pirellulaceae bacterium]